jgi:alanine racemase
MMTQLENIPAHVSAVLSVDLSAIAANYQAILTQLKPGTKAAAVVKDNAYGVGAEQVCKRLYETGCRDFFFAYIDEAIEGRKAIPQQDANVYVFYGVFAHTEHLFVEHRLIPSLISLEQVDRWTTFAIKQGKRLPCLLHLDTGMGREGLSPQEFQQFIARKDQYLQQLDFRYVISHLANSGQMETPKNEQQWSRFNEMIQHLPNIKTSLVNSGGIGFDPKFQFDLVRPGLALYGYKPRTGHYVELKPAITAYGRILMTRTVPKGETIGYQNLFECQRDTKLALIATGHGDGIARILSNAGAIKINGYRAQIVGRVSMDVVMVDITDHPEGNAIPGEWAAIYDDEASTLAFAKAEKTSIYELLVRHGNRYYRTYKN